MDQQKNKGRQSDSRPDQQRRNQSQTPNHDDTDPRHDMPGRDQSGRQWTQDQTGGQDSRSRNQGRQDTHGTGGHEKGRGMDREMKDEDEPLDRDPRQSER
jgi:hypothetical protein